MTGEVSLEDIDILAAIGDSYTAGFAAHSTNSLDYLTEYRGISFVTGETSSWTIPIVQTRH